MKLFDYDNLIVNEKLFGLEIVDTTVKALELKGSRGKFSISGFSEAEVTPEAVQNGNIMNNEAVAEAIKRARESARPHKIRQKYASVVLPDSKIFVRIVKFPVGMNKEEIRESIEWKAKDLIAMPLEQVYWDWHRLSDEESSNLNSDESEVVISAVEKECVDSYTKTLKLLGITPLYYDLSGNAAARFLFQDSYKKKRALLVRIDRNSSTLSLFLNGGVRYQTIIKDAVKGGYASLVDFAAAKLSIDKEKAEELILNPKNLDKRQKQILKEPFTAHYSTLLKEVVQILDYYAQTVEKEKKKKNTDFSGIYLYGKGAKVFYLREFFENQSYKVETKPETGSSVSPMLPFISKQGLPQNLVLLGLGLRNSGFFKELRDINLVPKSIKKKYMQTSIYSSLYSYLRMVFWGVFFVGLILAAALIIAKIYKYNVEEELKSVENISESKANIELREEITYVNSTAGQLSLLYNTQLDWDTFFEQVSDSRGNGIKLDNILVSEDENAWQVIAGQKAVKAKSGQIYMVVNGLANNRENLQEYVSEIENSELFENVLMPISNYEDNTNITFSIYCLVNTNLLKKDSLEE